MKSLTKTLLCLIAALPAARATSVLDGDTTGAARGADSIDIQSFRDSSSQVASGWGAVAVGLGNEASGGESASLGLYNITAGSQSFSFGLGNYVTGDAGSAVGLVNYVYAAPGQFWDDPAGAFGYYNIISLGADGSYAFGRNNQITAFRASVFGAGITNSTAYSTMIGPSNTAKLTILPSGFVGVGLGATAPAQMLDVGGSIRLTGSILKAGGGVLILPGTGTGTLPSTTGTVITNSGTQTITGATTIVGTATMGGSTAATQLKIDSGTGNIGIGIAPSTAKLHISGTGTDRGLRIQATGTGASDYAEAQFAANAREYRVGVGGSGTTIGMANKFYVWDAVAGAARMVVDTAGNIGIGTTSPGAKVSVVGGVASQMGMHINNTMSSGYSVLRLGTDTASPLGTALHDFGSTHTASGNAGAYQSDQTALSSFRPNGLSLHANANAPIKFFTAGYAVSNERMRIAGDGNVGIGTGATAPAAKLDINGDAKVATTLTVGGNLAVNGLATKLRVAEQGDISMGAFTAQP